MDIKIVEDKTVIKVRVIPTYVINGVEIQDARLDLIRLLEDLEGTSGFSLTMDYIRGDDYTEEWKAKLIEAGLATEAGSNGGHLAEGPFLEEHHEELMQALYDAENRFHNTPAYHAAKQLEDDWNELEGENDNESDS